jgi:hypothetical protein
MKRKVSLTTHYVSVKLGESNVVIRFVLVHSGSCYFVVRLLVD